MIEIAGRLKPRLPFTKSAGTDSLAVRVGGLRRRSRNFSCQVFLLLLYLGIWSLTTRPVMAQTSTPDSLAIQELQVRVMPEFDDPRVLVIVQGRMAGAESGRATWPITFRVPQGAQINQTAVMDVTTGQTDARPFQTQPDPADPRWLLVSYTLDSAHFFYEYYDDPLPDLPEKQFTFTFNSPQPVDRLMLEVQQPLKATQWQLEPPADSTRLDSAFGFTYHRYERQALAANQELSIAIRYTKTDPAPSVSREQLAAGSNSSSTEPAVEDSGNTPTWVIALVGGAGLVSLALFGLAVRPKGKGSRPRQELAGGKPANAGYCTQCGEGLRPGARFCHACGQEVSP